MRPTGVLSGVQWAVVAVIDRSHLVANPAHQRGMGFMIVHSNGKHALGNMTRHEQGKLLR